MSVADYYDATAATNHNTRHPLITGSWATTMHRLSPVDGSRSASVVASPRSTARSESRLSPPHRWKTSHT